MPYPFEHGIISSIYATIITDIESKPLACMSSHSKRGLDAPPIKYQTISLSFSPLYWSFASVKPYYWAFRSSQLVMMYYRSIESSAVKSVNCISGDFHLVMMYYRVISSKDVVAWLTGQFGRFSPASFNRHDLIVWIFE